MSIGDSEQRLDATAKVTGRSRFTSDLMMPGTRVAKYLRSKIAHGRVTSIDTSEARALAGVDAVFTFADIPKIPFATAGHAYSLDPKTRDVEDRLLLTDYVRYHGDEIAIVVATDQLIAEKALQLIRVSYDEYPPLLNHQQAMDDQAPVLHNKAFNKVGEHEYELGNPSEMLKSADLQLAGSFQTQMVQHCHLENQIAMAYMDDTDHIVIVSSTQIPHICRRIVAQALSWDMSRIRVVKPTVGGGFGNKQDVVLEPMAAFLTLKLGGIPVQIDLDREETMLSTRVRHPISVDIECGVNKDGTLKALSLDVISNTGAYASHGHSIAKSAGAKLPPLYPKASLRYHAMTHYSTLPAAGAMRGYGSPQIVFAVESMVEEAARKIGMDSVEFRLRNAAQKGDMNPLTDKHITSCAVRECLRKGKEHIQWDLKKNEYRRSNESSENRNIRHGLGVACFSYGNGTYPAGVEIAGARMILNQDGRITVQVGATEIGQGSDTAVAQMTAEYLNVPVSSVHVVSSQDTDVSPFDPGSFASRQTYVVSKPVSEAARELRQKILDYAAEMLDCPASGLELNNGRVTGNTGEKTLTLKELALDAYYHKQRGHQLTADVSRKTTSNASSYGCTFAEIEVDIELCQVKVLNILNVHDAGKIINPVLAAGQVHGGIGMGLSGAMSEELMVNPKTGTIYNGNLLDYKIATMPDMPDIGSDFVETNETTNAYGSKSVGEPPLLSVAPAIRNAILDATGVAMNKLPMSPKALFNAFREAQLIQEAN
ncbi:xanthine dehydrogenase [Endozoicomonas montiporae]|uniref:Xanthine dehydrogenase n=2 Tax=Endozoicomonas montiporae TaxID=1027273 RepID=A0A081N4S7_9GAMM|nr:xanthine dehydrogenase subunit XdhA [Endozoicomonas montiporae]AMO57681.1 xanthine dehydrogenase molybdenum-binding subunit [Endozoicomonas montiporae CL-33]KEQ13450.1 xanthine dehydrogenase [Endozoicomonas montiporae]